MKRWTYEKSLILFTLFIQHKQEYFNLIWIGNLRRILLLLGWLVGKRFQTLKWQQKLEKQRCLSIVVEEDCVDITDAGHSWPQTSKVANTSQSSSKFDLHFLRKHCHWRGSRACTSLVQSARRCSFGRAKTEQAEEMHEFSRKINFQCLVNNIRRLHKNPNRPKLTFPIHASWIW